MPLTGYCVTFTKQELNTLVEKRKWYFTERQDAKECRGAVIAKYFRKQKEEEQRKFQFELLKRRHWSGRKLANWKTEMRGKLEDAMSEDVLASWSPTYGKWTTPDGTQYRVVMESFPVHTCFDETVNI